MLAIDYKQRQGEFSNKNIMKKYGHDIIALLDTVTKEEFFGKNWITATAGAEDSEFLKSDLLHRELVSVLSHFGKFGRYSDLDVVAREKFASSPASDWKRIEMTILTNEDLNSLLNQEGY